MMLGASAAWAKTYTVSYEGLPTGTTGGFTIKNTSYFKTGDTYYDYYVYNLITSSDNSSDLTINDYYAVDGYPYTLSGDSYCISITSGNYADYITPNTYSDYKVRSVSVDETALKITISYSQVLTWSDGDFTYSNYHIQSTSNQGFMDTKFDYYPDKPEVAVSLKLGEPQSITDDIAYPIFYISSSNAVDDNGTPTGPIIVMGITTDRTIIILLIGAVTL